MDTSERVVVKRESQRRRWPVEEKCRIVEQTLKSGASVARVALAHGVNANQVFSWRRQAQEDLPRASYEKFSKGYANITRLYGVSNLNANRFAFIATTFRDQSAAREAFANITKMDESIWTYQSIFDNSREWANTP
jgi:transposase-like protein